jgi:hypothetical protein
MTAFAGVVLAAGRPGGKLAVPCHDNFLKFSSGRHAQSAAGHSALAIFCPLFPVRRKLSVTLPRLLSAYECHRSKV